MYTSARALHDSGTCPVLSYLGNLRSPFQLLKARTHVARLAPDFELIHCQWGSAAALACDLPTPCPKVVSLRGSDWTPAYSRRLASRIHGKLARYLTERALPTFNAIVCMSERLADEVSKQFPRKPVYVLPDPIDLNVFAPIDKRLARRQLGLPDTDHRYVMFGSYYSTKQLKRRWLAEAAVTEAQRYHPNLRFLPAHGIPHEQMPRLISAADVAICTSVSEGWPNIIKEALACNVPFVSTDVSDLRLIADRDQHCKVVPDDPRSLGSALAEVLSMPAPSDLRRHVQCMSLESHAQQLLSIYRSLS